ncbi:2-oxoglutarate dehydrogenase complex dihydrolipoyllysine-residue succinyltransferase [Bacteroidota bacterium]
MAIEIIIPSPGESISEVELVNWMVNDGDYVEQDQEIAEIESDKATLPLIAEKSGKIKILVQEGQTVSVGTVACTIDTSVKPDKKKDSEKIDKKPEAVEISQQKKTIEEEKSKVSRTSIPVSRKHEDIKVTPLAQNVMKEYNISLEDVLEGLRRITKKDVEVSREALEKSLDRHDLRIEMKKEKSRESERIKMTSLRRKVSERLVAVKNETAMLTTFNEVDMSKIIEIRNKYKDIFLEKHGVKLGFMSFFTKASSIALHHFPYVNAMIDGDEIVRFHFADIGIAVQTDKGLMVPVLRNVEAMSFAEIELAIMDLANKARIYRISIEEMTGGNFTITNGGVFGSMLSTPILNPPQSAILGMHNIVERPVAINKKVEIRPIMYVALSYDHRIIDGRDSVSFLYKIKELLEDPNQILMDGKDPDRLLLDL